MKGYLYIFLIVVEVRNVLVQVKASGDMEDKWGPTTSR